MRSAAGLGRRHEGPDGVIDDGQDHRAKPVLDERNRLRDDRLDARRQVQHSARGIVDERFAVADGGGHSTDPHARMVSDERQITSWQTPSVNRGPVPVAAHGTEVDRPSAQLVPGAAGSERSASSVRLVATSGDRLARNGPRIAQTDARKVPGDDELTHAFGGDPEQLGGPRQRQQIVVHRE